MRIDKTYSELWDLVNRHEDSIVRETAQMAINTLDKLQEENKRLLIKNNKLIKQIGIAFESDEII